jgi:hypothetical protein
LLLLGCDAGEYDRNPGSGPELELLSSYPADGDGLGCVPGGPADCGIPTNAAVELRVDRYLLPSTATRQSVVLFTGTDDLTVFGEPHYDVAERVLRYAPQPGQLLHPGARYRVRVVLPATDENGFGLRAFDGASMSPAGPAPLEFSFRTREASPPRVPPDPIPTCAAVLGVYTRGGCSSATCHQSATTPGCPVGYARMGAGACVGVPCMGLDLASGTGLSGSAISKVAHQTDSEANAGLPTTTPARFGLGMPTVDPGRPENSYLIYKLVVNRRSYGPEACGGSGYEVGLGGQCLAGSVAETDRLRDWFVRGDPMPPPGSGFLLEAADLRLVERWIVGGASTDDCDAAPSSG